MWLCRRQTDCLITLTWAGGECWSCRQGGVAEAQNADPVRRFASLQVKPCKLDFDAALRRQGGRSAAATGCGAVLRQGLRRPRGSDPAEADPTVGQQPP